MGILINKVCCIDTNEIFENTNFKNTINDSILGREDSTSYSPHPTSELKSLPVSDMHMNTSRTPKIKIKSLSRIPISTKNFIRKQSGNPFDNYKILKELGHGTFGQVYKIIHKKTGNIRAMKIIPKNNLKPGFTDKDIISEITIMKNLDHPHIIKLYEFYIDEYNYYLINEFCTEGDLSEKMYKLKSLPEPIVKIIMAQIFTAVLYLNNRGIIHGDLKLENILVDSYLDDGGNKNFEQKEKNNFISSLIQDAKNIKNYISKLKLKRSSTNFINNIKLNKEKKDENAKKEENEQKGEKNEENEAGNGNNENDKGKKKLRNTLKIELVPRQNRLKSDTKLEQYIENDQDIIYECEEKKENDNLKSEERKDNYDNSNKKSVEEEDNFNLNSNLKFNLSKDSSSVESENNDSSKMFTPLKVQKKEEQFIPNEEKDIKNLDIHMSAPIFNKEYKEDSENIPKEKKSPQKIVRKSTYNYNKLKIKNFELKLIDFGCSKIFTQYRRTFEDTIGTLVYCSPEVLKNNYNQKCDIWSCGVIMYILLSGKYPFYGNSEEEITKKILVGNYDFNDKHFENVSEIAKDLIRKCLIHDKNKRISVKDAIKHEFFAGEIDINNIFEDEVDTKIILNNLKNNSRKISKFYQTVLAYLSYNFADKEELKKLRKIFYKIDLNLDGKISKEELCFAYKEAGIKVSKEELEKIVKSIDFDGNGSIEYEEFIRVTLSKEQLFTDINLKTAFDMFDLDKNGSISLNEILEVIGADKDIDKNVIQQLKEEILKDGDEEMDFKHFKEIMLGLKEEEKIKNKKDEEKIDV